MFNKIIKICIYLLVFLLPIFWLPFSFEPFEFNKQYLLFFLVSLSFFAWISRMFLVDKEIKLKRTPLDIFVAVFIFVAVLSVIFSVDKSSSIFGFYGRFSDGLIGLLSLGALYLLIINNTQINTDKNTDKHKLSVSGLTKIFTGSVFFVVLFSYFSVFNLWQSVIKSGNVGGLGVFLSVVLSFLTAKILLGEKKEKGISIINYLLLLASLFLLLIINFKPAWLVLLAALMFFVAFTLWKRTFKEMSGKLVLPIILMVIAGLFIITNYQFPIFNFQLTRETVLGQGTSWQVGFAAATDNAKSGFLGSGPGTYFYDFSKFKPKEFNDNPFWQIRFDRSGNYMSELLGTMGFLGFLSYLALVAMFLLISWILINTDKKRIPLLMGFLALIAGQFVYYQNTTLVFLFWLFLSLLVVSWEKPLKEITFSLQKFPEINLVAKAILAVIGLGFLASYYFGFQTYRADIIYAKSQSMPLGEERTVLIEKAAKLNPNFVQYQIILARAYLDDTLREMRKPKTEQDSLVFQAKVANTIDTAKNATQKGQNLVAAWETLGMVYRDIRLVASGALEWGIKSFEKAIVLEPTNPVLYTELGKLYLSSDDIQKAKEQFAKAKELKVDYIDVLIQEALVLEKEEKLDEAVNKMEELSLNYPFNTEVLFQLGRFYFNANKVNDAILQLEKVINAAPNHSNALYSLGIAYQKKGQKSKAIEVFEKVLELNPGNEDVIKKLEELKKK